MNWVASFYLRYASLGFSVIPVKTLAYAERSDPLRDAKRALVKWKQYQQTPPSIDLLMHWAHQWPLAGIAVITGLLSDLFTVDDDRRGGRPPLERSARTEKAEEQFQRILQRYGSEAAVIQAYRAADEFADALDQLQTAKSRTGRGHHYLFLNPRDENGFKIPIGDSVKFLPGLDTRAEGGYILVPPSIHPSGTSYVWERQPEDGILPLPDWVLQAVKTLPNFAHYALSERPEATPGELHNTGMPKSRWRLGQFGVIEGERNDTAASMVGKILFDIPNEHDWPVIGWNAFIDWNRNNNPPLSAEELRATWNSITEKERKKRGTTFENAYTPHVTGAMPELLTARAIGLMDLHAPDFAVRDFIVDGTTQLFGKPKAGKSFLALQTALAVAWGEPLFPPTASMYAYANHPQGYDTHQGDVLYLALEDSYLRLKNRMRAILGTADVTRWPERLTVVNSWPNCFDGGLTMIEDWLRSVEHPRLVCVDTIAAFMGEPPSKPGTQIFRAEYRMFRPIWETSQRFKVPFLLVDHASKGKGKWGSQDPFDAGAGTLGSQAAVDTVMIMEHDDKGPRARLNIKGRDVERGFVDLEHSKDSPVWKIALPPIESTVAENGKTTDHATLGIAKNGLTVAENTKDARLRKMVDPFSIPV